MKEKQDHVRNAISTWKKLNLSFTLYTKIPIDLKLKCQEQILDLVWWSIEGGLFDTKIGKGLFIKQD